MSNIEKNKKSMSDCHLTKQNNIMNLIINLYNKITWISLVNCILSDTYSAITKVLLFIN